MVGRAPYAPRSAPAARSASCSAGTLKRPATRRAAALPAAWPITKEAPLARAASAGGLISTNRLVAQALGAALLAGLLNLGYGSDSTPAFIAAALAFCAGICSLARLTMLPAPAEVE